MNPRRIAVKGTVLFLFLTGGVFVPALGAHFRYFNDSYEILQKKALTLQSQGSLKSFNSSDATVKTAADMKKSILDNFYGSASSFGKTDVDGASTILRNEVRMGWDAKQLKKPQAFEALYCSEASIKFLLDKDKGVQVPNLPALLPGFENRIQGLVGQAEAAYAAGQYVKMRKLFYHAIWIAYPVTSSVVFQEPKD